MIARGSSSRGLSDVTNARSLQALGDVAHEGALGPVPVAPAAEDGEHAAVGGEVRASPSTTSSPAGVWA